MRIAMTCAQHKFVTEKFGLRNFRAGDRGSMGAADLRMGRTPPAMVKRRAHRRHGEKYHP